MSDRERGFALLIVLWTVGFLALLGTQIVAAARTNSQLAANLRQEAVLEAAANGAIAHVLFQMSAAKDPHVQANALIHEIQIGRTTVFVRIQNEMDRVDINTASATLLRDLIIEAGGAAALADRLAGAILDWRTPDNDLRSGGAKAPAYRAAGLAYGPPGAPFQSVGELVDVLGMSLDLLERLEPHLTVLTNTDPTISTRDPVVARALANATGVVDNTQKEQPAVNQIVRISVTAVGRASSQYAMVVVASTNFQNASPRINILLRERGGYIAHTTAAAASDDQ